MPATSESQLRIPARGRMSLEVETVPRFDLVVVPIVVASDPNGEVHRWVEDITPNSDKLRLVRSVLPIAELSVKHHEGFVSTADLSSGAGWGELLGELIFLRIREGERGYYYGALNLDEDAHWDGLGQIGYPASVGRSDPATLAHELGHNLGLRHAPCGGAAGVDKAYPYDGGEIGVWGYDFLSERVVHPSLYKDVMGYCDPTWISDYSFARAMGFRLYREAGVMGDVAAAAADEPIADDVRTLLLWGRVGDGKLVLDPAFMVDAPVTLPTEDGPLPAGRPGPAGRAPLLAALRDPEARSRGRELRLHGTVRSRSGRGSGEGGSVGTGGVLHPGAGRIQAHGDGHRPGEREAQGHVAGLGRHLAARPALRRSPQPGGGERGAAVLSRDGRIRTGDPLNPIQVRYRTAPRPVSRGKLKPRGPRGKPRARWWRHGTGSGRRATPRAPRRCRCVRQPGARRA